MLSLLLLWLEWLVQLNLLLRLQPLFSLIAILVARCAKSARVLTLVHTGPGSTETICAPGAGFPELQM